MATIDIGAVSPERINRAIKALPAEEPCVLEGCLGQRFIGAGLANRNVVIHGIPGNALGAYLDGATLEVFGNAQDAVGDTMNAGRIIIHGNVGDTCGYAMRGGEIYVQGNAGYRTGVHMKAYGDTCPVMVVGGRVGSFLGEYQAGGLIIVLGLEAADTPSPAAVPAGVAGSGTIAGNFPCTGMHGGKVILRGRAEGLRFPAQVSVRPAGPEDLAEIAPYVCNYGTFFGVDAEEILAGPYTLVSPRSGNPYGSMYVDN
ncbi:MAG: glutamate synthase [Eggerthellaceae bacterium]|nr:glutamate synthase [Eggerthellaceae bacterium]